MLKIGSVINDWAHIDNKSYLNQFKLRYSHEGEKPIIGKISYVAFRECLKKSNIDHIEKLVLFIKSIPGFEELTKNLARKIIG